MLTSAAECLAFCLERPLPDTSMPCTIKENVKLLSDFFALDDLVVVSTLVESFGASVISLYTGWIKYIREHKLVLSSSQNVQLLLTVSFLAIAKEFRITVGVREVILRECLFTLLQLCYFKKAFVSEPHVKLLSKFEGFSIKGKKRLINLQKSQPQND